MYIEIPRSLDNDIMSFVRLNKIEDINGFLTICLRNGFNIVKYGISPQDNFNKENKPLNIEVYDTEEKSNVEGLERKETKRRGRPKKQQSTNEESVIQKEEKVEPIKPKKKITIIKK